MSSFGQNFFLAVFGGAFRDAFDLSNGQFGLLYFGITVTSAIALVWLGRLVDRWPVPLVGAITISVLTGAALLLSASRQVASFALALLGVRLFGQGMAVQLSVTAVARSADVGARGRSLSLSALGNPIGESTLPVAAVAAMGSFGWHTVWMGVAAALVAIALPALLALSRTEGRSGSGAGVAAGAVERQDIASGPASWTVGEALRHPLFYLLLPALLAPNVLNTSIFSIRWRSVRPGA